MLVSQHAGYCGSKAGLPGCRMFGLEGTSLNFFSSQETGGVEVSLGVTVDLFPIHCSVPSKT